MRAAAVSSGPRSRLCEEPILAQTWPSRPPPCRRSPGQRALIGPPAAGSPPVRRAGPALEPWRRAAGGWEPLSPFEPRVVKGRESLSEGLKRAPGPSGSSIRTNGGGDPAPPRPPPLRRGLAGAGATPAGAGAGEGGGGPSEPQGSGALAGPWQLLRRSPGRDRATKPV